MCSHWRAVNCSKIAIGDGKGGSWEAMFSTNDLLKTNGETRVQSVKGRYVQGSVWTEMATVEGQRST